MYYWMQELHKKNFTDAESSDFHEKNGKAQKTKKKAIFAIRDGFFSPVKKKKKFGVRNFPAMGRVGGVVVEISGVCGVGGSYNAPNEPGRAPPSPVDVNDGQSPPRHANGAEGGQFLHENDARGCPQATGVPSGPSRGCRAKRWPPGWVAYSP